MTTTHFFRCLLVSLSLPLTALAQTKVEIERSVDEAEVPEVAVRWLTETYQPTPKVRWYFERTSGAVSYEAKLRQAGHWHSVEFTEDGALEDIEIKINKRSLPKETYQGIAAYLDTTYTRHRIRKIQRQLSGDARAVQASIREAPSDEVTIRYELEFYGNGEKKALWEGLFDDQGKLLNRREVVLRPTDNLAY